MRPLTTAWFITLLSLPEIKIELALGKPVLQRG
jgi:hypothetical protein